MEGKLVHFYTIHVANDLESIDISIFSSSNQLHFLKFYATKRVKHVSDTHIHTHTLILQLKLFCTTLLDKHVWHKAFCEWKNCGGRQNKLQHLNLHHILYISFHLCKFIHILFSFSWHLRCKWINYIQKEGKKHKNEIARMILWCISSQKDSLN